MRHNVKKKMLGRTPAHRKSMIRNLAVSLIEHGRIETTVLRTRELRIFIEPIITLGKQCKQLESSGDMGGALAKRRVALKKLPNKSAVFRLFEEISPQYLDRPGGYTRILRTGNRKGDNSEKAIIEFVK